MKNRTPSGSGATGCGFNQQLPSAKSSTAFATDVTRYTNTQNAIEKRDFVALDPEQERIKQELHIEGVEYAYKSGSTTGNLKNRFDLTEATIAQACCQQDVALAVQAKREISKLWEDLTKAPYKQLFNAGITGPAVWQNVQALRAIQQALTTEAKKYSGRDGLICVHGNRFIEWATLKSLELKPNQPFTLIEKLVQPAVQNTVAKVIAAVKSDFSDSYPASLFKNLGKCKSLAEKM